MTKMAPKPPQTRGIAHVPFPKLEGGTSQENQLYQQVKKLVGK